MELLREDFDEIQKKIISFYGIDLSRKYELVKNRLTTFAIDEGYNDLHKFIKAIKKNPFLYKELVNRLTTNYTYFFREKEHFKILKEKIIPEIMNKNPNNLRLKIWSAGCSKGNEAYSIAITLEEMLGLKLNYSIYGTDISTKVLNFANKGIYTREDLKKIEEDKIMKYFNKIRENQFQVIDRLVKKVYFSELNLMLPFNPFFNNFNIIFCRNVMIYFPLDVKIKLINKFYNVLQPGGYLIIGKSEILPKTKNNFKLVQQSIYRKEL
ncbi:CheR family methyltransferase [Fusobacterium sp. MFO224]|uniref:CheR family methyltransferase n=1 Tax=Fusobacterium sp. MFO224 TaxID=3378070 RepID=UPI0038520CD2